jgi:hypothetical protein
MLVALLVVSVLFVVAAYGCLFLWCHYVASREELLLSEAERMRLQNRLLYLHRAREGRAGPEPAAEPWESLSEEERTELRRWSRMGP